MSLNSADLLLAIAVVAALVFSDRVLLYSSGWSGTHYIGQMSINLIELCLSLPPECLLTLKVCTIMPSSTDLIIVTILLLSCCYLDIVILK